MHNTDKTSSFDKSVLIEQLRHIEAEHVLETNHASFEPDYTTHNTFEDCLWQRAKRLVEHNSLSSELKHAERLSGYSKTIALALAAFLGAMASIYAVTGSHMINIYWLLLVLLGFNLLSMLLWLLGISINQKTLTAGMLSKLTNWLPGHFLNKSQYGVLADRAWLSCHFEGTVGKWRLSKLTHELWLVYLLAGFSILVLQLMTRQYDFVWGTTLLSDTSFVKLTEVLSVPLQMLGLTMPSAEQVVETRIGAVHTLTADHRYHWAQFLLGALLLFGILPRIFLWFWSLIMAGVSRRRFKIDYYLPYYISLRQQLMPLASHGEIIDTDISPPDISDAIDQKPGKHTLPVETHWVSVELGNDIEWPLVFININNDLGQVVDSDSQLRIQKNINENLFPEIAVAVSASRPADRGVQRIVKSLVSANTQRWLVLLKHNEQEIISSARLAAWYQLARDCNIPADHVISLNVA